MTNKNLVVYGIYPNKYSIDTAVQALKNQGYRSSDISVLYSDAPSSKPFRHLKSTKAPEGIALGSSAGALVGGILGWLTVVGDLYTPTAGIFVSAGPVLGLFAGIGAGGLFGGLVGAVFGLRYPEYEAKRFEGLIKKGGGILVSVHCDNDEWVKRATAIMKETDGRDIASTEEARSDIRVAAHNQVLKTA